MFNNTIPQEFVDLKNPNYIPTDEGLRSLNVISKNEWNKRKQEINEIKRELSLLMPQKVFIEKQTYDEIQKAEENKMKDHSGLDSLIYEEGSVLKIKNVPEEITQKHQLSE